MGKRWRQFSRHASEGLFPIQWNGSRSVHGALWKMRLCVHAANCQAHLRCRPAFATSKNDQAAGCKDRNLESGAAASAAHSSQESPLFDRILFRPLSRQRMRKSLQDDQIIPGEIAGQPGKTQRYCNAQDLVRRYHRSAYERPDWRAKSSPRVRAGLIIGDQQAKVQKSLDRARKAYSRFDRAKASWKVTDPKQHEQASSAQESAEQ